MPEPRTQLMTGRARARGRGRAAAPIALVALLGWPAAAGALELTTQGSPPALTKVQKTVRQTVDDAKRGLGNAMDSAKRSLGAGGGGSRGVPQGKPEPLGVARDRRDAEPAPQARKRTAQQRSGRDRDGDDIDELVASGDEIGSARANGRHARGQVERPSQPLPFTGFNPVRLSLAGLCLILAGLTLIGARSEGLGEAGPARAT